MLTGFGVYLCAVGNVFGTVNPHSEMGFVNIHHGSEAANTSGEEMQIDLPTSSCSFSHTGFNLLPLSSPALPALHHQTYEKCFFFFFLEYSSIHPKASMNLDKTKDKRKA